MRRHRLLAEIARPLHCCAAPRFGVQGKRAQHDFAILLITQGGTITGIRFELEQPE